MGFIYLIRPMKRFILSLLCLISFAVTLLAQDNIIMRNGKEIKGKVEEVTLDEIKYRKADNLTGPVYTVLKSDVFMVKYANGTKENFSSSENPVPSPEGKEHFKKENERVERRERNPREVRERRERPSRREVDPDHQATKNIVGGAVMLGLGIPALAGGVTLTSLAVIDLTSNNANTAFTTFFDGPILATGIILSAAGVVLNVVGAIKLSKGLKYRHSHGGPSFGFTPIHNPGLDRYNYTMNHQTIGAVTLTF